MRMLRFGAILVLAATLAVAATAAPATDDRSNGRLLASHPWPALPHWGALDDFTRSFFSHQVYEEARTQKDFQFLDISYSSDGIPVRGLLIKPRRPGRRKWPAIVFNRGGTGDYGRIANYGASCQQEDDSCLYRVSLYLLAKAGFVVIASDYRFHGPTGRRDEWGGVDVDDVLNIIPTVKSLDFVDPERVYMFGQSRGGTMTYIALKRGAPVKAAAVIAGPSDLTRDTKTFIHGDWFTNGNEWFDGAAKVWPDYEHLADDEYRSRSAIAWADQINVPILIMQSRTDTLVPVTQSLKIAAALQEKNKVYALHIYDHDGHLLPRNLADRNRRIIDWFNEYGAGAIPVNPDSAVRRSGRKSPG